MPRELESADFVHAAGGGSGNDRSICDGDGENRAALVAALVLPS
jgi:hypothetical protein